MSETPQSQPPQSIPLPPSIERAAREGQLSPVSLDDLASEDGAGIGLAQDQVVVLLQPIPTRAPRTVLEVPSPRSFEGQEHRSIGDSVRLRFVPAAEPVAASETPLRLPNGLKLRYGDVLALGGDFYGIPDNPVSDGKTADDRIRRFGAAFASLAVSPAARAEAPRILEVLREEANALERGRQQGKPASEVYAELGDSLSAKWNRITGGGTGPLAWLPLGRYLKLARTNWDHFAPTRQRSTTPGIPRRYARPPRRRRSPSRVNSDWRSSGPTRPTHSPTTT